MPEKCVIIVLDVYGGAITQVKAVYGLRIRSQGSFPNDYGCVGLQDK